MKKPQNHVTRQLDAFRSGEDKVAMLPVLERAQMDRLEELYPPRCLARTDTVEDHLRYAGMVELVANLRARRETHEADNTEEPDLAGAERAS